MFLFRWTIKARVIHKSSVSSMECAIPGKPATNYFFVVLEDGSGTIRARAWKEVNCKKFYRMFQVNSPFISRRLIGDNM